MEVLLRACEGVDRDPATIRLPRGRSCRGHVRWDDGVQAGAVDQIGEPSHALADAGATYLLLSRWYAESAAHVEDCVPLSSNDSPARTATDPPAGGRRRVSDLIAAVVPVTSGWLAIEVSAQVHAPFRISDLRRRQSFFAVHQTGPIRRVVGKAKEQARVSKYVSSSCAVLA
jgi:hypothetical protein